MIKVYLFVWIYDNLYTKAENLRIIIIIIGVHVRFIEGK